MSAIGRTLRGGLFAAGVLATMGSGAAAVFDRPAEAQAPPSCDPERCNRYCEARHGPFAHGECWGDECLCAI